MPASVSLKRRKSWLLAASALAPLSLGVSEPALAQTFSTGGNPYSNGISVSNTGTPTNVTLEPGVQVFVTPGTINQAVAVSTGTAAGTGLPATLTANNAAVTITSNPGAGPTSALFLRPIGGKATITASGIMSAAGTSNTNAIWAAIFRTTQARMRA